MSGVSLEEALVDLYLLVKVRDHPESQEQLLKDKQKLKKQSPFLVIEYIKASIDVLMNLKEECFKPAAPMEEGYSSRQSDAPEEYEKMVQKLEAD